MGKALGKCCRCRCCGGDDDDDDDTDQQSSKVLDKRHAFWDDHGNLRNSDIKSKLLQTKQEKVRIPIEVQMKNIMALRDDTDADKEEMEKARIEKLKEDDELADDHGAEETTWYIMESAWCRSWMAHVYSDTLTAPDPGPCNNRMLLAYDLETMAWTSRQSLKMDGQSKGHYRRVTEDVWTKFKEMYPGSGPTIKTMFLLTRKDNVSINNGYYSTEDWEVVDPPDVPEEVKKKLKEKEKLLKNKKKKKKKKSKGGPKETDDEEGAHMEHDDDDVSTSHSESESGSGSGGRSVSADQSTEDVSDGTTKKHVFIYKPKQEKVVYNRIEMKKQTTPPIKGKNGKSGTIGKNGKNEGYGKYGELSTVVEGNKDDSDDEDSNFDLDVT